MGGIEMMDNTNFEKTKAVMMREDKARRKREWVIAVGIVFVVAILTLIENRIFHFGADIPVSNTILMFTLININLLLLILLIFLVFRNLVKLLYDRRRRVMGAKLRTRLVVAFIALTLLPTTVLFFFSINFITTSFKFWFNVPVEHALDNALQVGRSVYDRAEKDSQFFIERAAYQISHKQLLDDKNAKALSRYIQIVQREFNFAAVEVYDANAKRLTFALAPEIENKVFDIISADKLLVPSNPDAVWTNSEFIASGELFRTIGTIPFGVVGDQIQAFIVMSDLISPDLSQSMKSIARGFEEYQQIKFLKTPIQNTYYIVLSIVALLVLFCAIWFGFYLAKSISIPIKELAEGTRKVAEGKLTFSIDMVADDEIGSLVDSFNRMTRDLRVIREQLVLSSLMLQQQNIEIEKRRRYMEIVLNNVSAGVITLDAGGAFTTINKAAERMLNLNAAVILSQKDGGVSSGIEHLKFSEEIVGALAESSTDSIEMPLRMAIGGRPRSFLVYANALRDDASNRIGAVMVLDDLTELEKAQRMAAWREVARRIAHEVKNPLTPITLSAQRLKRKYAGIHNDPVFDECIRLIIDHVDLIRNLVNEFSFFARFPAAELKLCELPPIIEETVELYRDGHKQIHFETQIKDNFPLLNLDHKQIKQAIINLLDNAITAIRPEGRITISMSHDPIFKRARIEIADDGPGISDEDKTRLFEPNFSTKKTGMGLGLTIVNTIIADHNGVISVQDNPPRGAKFVIELPA